MNNDLTDDVGEKKGVVGAQTGARTGYILIKSLLP
jgi:hypothetical protein